MTAVVFKHFHLFCGLGGGKKGFNRGRAAVGRMTATYRCIGGIDVDPAAIRDFNRIAGAPGTVLDLFSREQYVAFHGREPGRDWREAMPADIRAAAHGEYPDVAFLSAPCKGFSGLLAESLSKTAKYQALNGLTLRGVWLMLEAFKDNPPGLVVFENVPRIAKRGRHLLDQICALLRSYGYDVAETTHDCGELGGLGQSRKRFLLVARHREKVPPFLWEPPKRRLRGVGEVLEKLPLPGDPAGGPMHRMPSLQWKTWVRLAFVEAGSDWRSLNKLAVENGLLRDYAIEPECSWQGGVLGVRPWGDPSGVVAGRSSVTNGTFAVADPRFEGLDYQQYGVRDWGQTTGAVINVRAPGQGGFSVADPRPGYGSQTMHNVFRVVQWGGAATAVTAGHGPSSGGQAVADPRPGRPSAELHGKFHVTPFDAPARAVIAGRENGAYVVADPRPPQRSDYAQTKYRVTGMDEASGAVIAASTTGNGAFAVADPRPINELRNGAHGVREWGDTSGAVAGESLPPNGAFSVADPRPVGLNARRENYMTGGHYGVVPWEASSGAVPGYGKYDRGNWSVADPREVAPEPLIELPKPDDRLVAVIRALDNTWHRPFTTLELAALQSLVDPDEVLTLDGASDSAWRERIGNAVPPDAAEAIANVMATTLLLAMTGETFLLSSEPIWVQPLVVALSVDHSPNAGLLD